VTDPKAVTAALAAPFDPSEVKHKPGIVSGNRALALAYVDARAIQDRLDEVVGVDGWQDDYECLPDGSVVCRLRCRIGGEWLTKVDVGSPSEQPDGGDRLKAAFSDALKRAAVKFGVGRYLYRLPAQWVDYDPQHRRLKGKPGLPAPAAAAAAVPPSGLRPLDEIRQLLKAKGKAEDAAAKWASAEGTTKLEELSEAEVQKLLAYLRVSHEGPCPRSRLA
jgi:hypothetical protein